jgi:hypothetical protein
MRPSPGVVISRQPRLSHVAESGGSPGIEERGLLSTTALLHDRVAVGV